MSISIGKLLRSGLSLTGMKEAVNITATANFNSGKRAVRKLDKAVTRLTPESSLQKQTRQEEEEANRLLRGFRKMAVAVAMPFVSLKYHYYKAQFHEQSDNTIDKAAGNFGTLGKKFANKVLKPAANRLESGSKADQAWAYKKLSDTDRYILKSFVEKE
ncbi:hypothetical protein [Parendozoicomonas haliclonae]|uniref:Uncharacterized protein n=1 Tax=Parendozoicomonas haliclonae TaxID=1960125 RepID=A0A1X7AHP5_9GAMM|nr:hypothetical protein [Parendozoicomonas haliclonae]SMA41945.1 hypothetical protein EHSB41UT_01364 [Parendozoicomonas haliclonae]